MPFFFLFWIINSNSSFYSLTAYNSLPFCLRLLSPLLRRPLLCVSSFTAPHETSALPKRSDSDIGRNLQGSYWISIMTSCGSWIPPFLCSPSLPPPSSSISFLVFSLPLPSLVLHSSPHPLFFTPVLFLFPHVLCSPLLKISLTSSSPSSALGDCWCLSAAFKITWNIIFHKKEDIVPVAEAATGRIWKRRNIRLITVRRYSITGRDVLKKAGKS